MDTALNEELILEEIEKEVQEEQDEPKNECPATWFRSVQNGDRILQDDFVSAINNYYLGHFRYIQKENHPVPIELILKLAIRSVQLFYKDDGQSWSVALDEAFKLLEDKKVVWNLEDGVYSGLLYILQTTKFELLRLSSSNKDDQNVEECDSLVEMPIPTLKTVIASKLVFASLVECPLVACIEFVKSLLSFGGDSQIHHLAYRALRRIRKNNENTYNRRPSDFEVQALKFALAMDPKNPYIRLSACKYLRDLLKKPVTDRTFGDMSFVIFSNSNDEFDSKESVSEFISKEIQSLTTELPNSVSVAIFAGDFYMDLKIHQDICEENKLLAKDLYSQAVEIDGQLRAKPIFKLANWYIQTGDDENIGKNLLSQSFEIDPYYAAAVSAYFWYNSRDCSMDDVHHNQEILSAPVVGSWANHLILDCSFIQGCIKFVLNLTVEASEEWLKAFELSYEYFRIRIHTLHRNLLTFGWMKKDDLSYENIKRLLDESIKLKDWSPRERKNLEVISNMIHRKTEREGNQREGRERSTSECTTENKNWRGQSFSERDDTNNNRPGNWRDVRVQSERKKSSDCDNYSNWRN